MPDEPDLSPEAAEGRDQEREAGKPRRLTPKEKAARAAQLRVAGYSYADIAKALGYAQESGAWKACERARNAALRESGQALIALELDRFDTLQRAAMTKAVAGDARSINAALRVMDARAKLLGLHEQRGQERIAEARDAFAVLLSRVQDRHPDPEPDGPDDEQETAA